MLGEKINEFIDSKTFHYFYFLFIFIISFVQYSVFRVVKPKTDEEFEIRNNVSFFTNEIVLVIFFGLLFFTLFSIVVKRYNEIVNKTVPSIKEEEK